MDPAKMKVVDLRSELGALGLDTKGNKPALVERLKKALEAKTGKAIVDTTILDTSTEDADEPVTPRRPGPAARTTRRSSSSRISATPAKQPRTEKSPEPIEEESRSPTRSASPERAPQPVPPPAQPEPEPAPEPETVRSDVAQPDTYEPSNDLYSIDDDKQSSEEVSDEKSHQEEEKMDVDQDQDTKPTVDGNDEVKQEKQDGEDKENEDEKEEEEERKREISEEEEWRQLNERLKQREQERLEREKAQADADALRLKELQDDPVRLNRLKRKHEKKARWSNFYRSVEVANEVLAPPLEEETEKQKNKEVVDIKIPEPKELDDNKVTLSWYDSDLNQYMELPSLSSVVPLSDGAFTHAWAGARATHGVTQGTVCYEVRVGAVVTTTEPSVDSKESSAVASGLRVGWSTDHSTLHLGEGEHSWGYESTGRAVNNSEFKEYGKEFKEKDVIGAYLDLESSPCRMFFTLNGEELGTAYEFDKEHLNGKPLFPHVLTKNTCYKVNFGYDRYNMLTRTKIVRKRIEIPIEQVLEEKKRREEEIQKQKEEAAKKEKERREKLRLEREERQRKKREEREKQEREKKQKEAEEKRARGEEVPEEDEKKEDKKEENKEEEQNDKETNDKEANPQENGEATEEKPSDKPEPMETDAEKADNTEETDKPKEDAAPEGEVPEVTEEQVFKGVTLDKRIKFVIRYIVEQELDGEEASLLSGYVLIAHAGIEPGPRRPHSLADCEVILMVGLPGAGKTHWARSHAAANPDKRYNILSTGALFDKMKVDCKPYRATYEGRWDAMVSKCAKCVVKLLEIAKGRRRNFILDQRRKLREFEGYRRVAVVIVPSESDFTERAKRREEADGKEVPDGAIMDMKANFTLPEKGPWLDDVMYPELGPEEAKAAVEAFHVEAKAAGVQREREKRSRSDSRPASPAKRAREHDRRRKDDRRPPRDFPPRDREERWGGGGSRWGPASRGGGGGGGGGGAGRWGRDRNPPPRMDRWGPPPPRDFGGRGDRDMFGGGRGGGGGRGERGAARGMPGPPARFDRPGRDRPPQGPPMPQGGGGAGTWQRGGQSQRGAAQGRGQGPPPPRNQKDGGVGGGQNSVANQQQQQQQGWNQWAGGWGGWGNWNQNQAGWGNWGNWGQWPNAGGAQGAGGAAGGAAGGKQGGWPANYTAQQWYQWQQWQQQQQGWPGYQQGNQQAGNAADAQQAWAQYYQNYGAGAGAANANATQQAIDKK